MSRHPVLPPADPETHPWGEIRWLASAARGGAATTLGRVKISTGQANPRHRHPTCEETVHVLSGRIEHSLGDEWYPLASGETLVVPAGVAHQARNVGDEPAELLICYDRGTRDFALVAD